MVALRLLALSSWGCLAAAVPLMESMGVKSEWAELGRSDPKQMLEISFMVKQTNVAELERILLEVSDPDSQKYGQHLSNEQVHELISPKAESVDAVMKFLASHGIKGNAATPNSDMVVADVTIETAERLLKTEYWRFKHTDRGHVVDRAKQYGLPAHVAEHVDFVAPTVRLPAATRPVAEAADSSKGLMNTPKSLRKLYNVGDELGKNVSKQAVTGFLAQYYSAADLKEFHSLFFKAGADDTMATKGDAATGGLAGMESMLDAEYITAMGAHLQSEFWGFSGHSPDSKQNEPFLKWLQMVSATSDEEVPKLFSTSYGEDEDSVSWDYSARINTEFMKAGARGISLLFASGDSGAASQAHTCKNGKFVPQFPACSPYITAVGGTSGAGAPETAAGLASGGFSNRWPRPSWQDAAVSKFLKTPRLVALKSKYNATGRGFPDISAQAMSYIIVANRVPFPGISGTSCASPTAAGIFGLINDVRKQAGKPSLGFLNPFIYKHAAAFNDITTGGNGGCPETAGQGYPAVPGWDAVTGVGTPNYKTLKEAALGKQEAVVV